MSESSSRKHPVILCLDIAIVLLAVLEFVEALTHNSNIRDWIEGAAGLQVVLLAARGYAVWHAFRHL